MTTVREFLAEQAHRRREDKALVRTFAEAARTGDHVAMANTLEELSNRYLWREAIRALKNVSCPARDMRQAWVQIWIQNGDSLRSDINDDLALADAMRGLLPPYKGPAITLYRGESAWNRKRRTYGLPWTATLAVARDYALFHRKMYKGGSVLLETMAPPEAIICAPVHHDDRFDEQEYLVDRRRLHAVTVRERFEYLPDPIPPIAL